MAARGIKRAKSIQRIIAKLDKFIVAILVGNNFVNIAISAIVTAASILAFGYKWGIIIATFATAFFILIICEITPKILATKYTERIALSIAPVMEAFIKVFNPIITIFISASNLIIKLLRIKPTKRSPLITEEELRLMIEIGKDEGFLSDEETKLLHRIFEFGDTLVKDVMMQKDKIVGVNIDSNSAVVLNIFVEEGHARLPVYEGTIDRIIGIIYARDLLYILRDKGLFLLQDLIHEAYYVLPTMRVNELLKKFQAEKIQIAVVVDKDRKTQGLVTLEDLIEEIVGEIEERHTRGGSFSRIN
jgi:putative hemolysin